MEFTYESINNALNNKHYNLSSEWSTIQIKDDVAIVSYMMEDGSPDEVAIVDKNGNVNATPRLLKEMDDIG
tara:strand:- start:916 stop:1128 length:213 start_codon:yes stop_codon:yes gene_type:complete